MSTTQGQARWISPADTAKLVRAALKDTFPTVVFSVTSKSYAGGASISVHWTDGPPTGVVDKVAKRFAGASFDGMIDLKSYHTSALNGERVHYGADYVFTQRSYSPAAVALVKPLIDRDYDIAWSMDGRFDLGNRHHQGTVYGNELFWEAVQDRVLPIAPSAWIAGSI